MRKIKSKRWTEHDETIYYCEACERYHYIYSGIGRRHKKFAQKKSGDDSEIDNDSDDNIHNTRKKRSCEVCGKVTNLVPVVQNHKTVMVCRLCREKVKHEQMNEIHKPWNIGGVNLI